MKVVFPSGLHGRIRYTELLPAGGGADEPFSVADDRAMVEQCVAASEDEIDIALDGAMIKDGSGHFPRCKHAGTEKAFGFPDRKGEGCKEQGILMGRKGHMGKACLMRIDIQSNRLPDLLSFPCIIDDGKVFEVELLS